MAGGIAINQGAEADLVGDTGSREAFGNDAQDDAKHGGAAVKQFSPFELVHVDLGLAAGEFLVVGGGVGHGDGGGGELVSALTTGSAGFGRQVAGTRQHKGHHPGQDKYKGNDAGDGCAVVGAHGDQPAGVSKC